MNPYELAVRNAFAQLENQEVKEELPLEKSHTIQYTTPEPDLKKFAPIDASRSSEPDNGIGGFYGAKTILEPEFGIQWLGALDWLSVFNRHVGKALENVVTMSHTPHKIAFSDKISEREQQKMREYISGNEAKYYNFTGGSTGLLNDLFTQIVITGAASFESVPAADFKGLKKVVLVNPKNVRFRYDQDTDDYVPVQIPQTANGIRRLDGGYIVLNPLTYKYIAKRRTNDSPYGVPPFLTAVEDIMIQRDMIQNFKFMMKKLGMLGFLSVLVSKPPQKGESESEYYKKLENHLANSVVPLVEKQARNGIAIGYKDQHEFKLQGSDINGSNAKDLMQIINTLVYEGLKQDPNLHGENFSTTETMGNVILGIMSQQCANYQWIAAKALEEIYILDLTLAGFRPGSCTVEFEKPNLKDGLKNEQTEELKIRNVEKKILMGIIGQTQGAQELGYEKPFLKEPPAAKLPPTPVPPAAKEKTADASNVAGFIDVLLELNHADAPEFDYYIPDACNKGPQQYVHKIIKHGNGSIELSADFGSDSHLEKVANSYNRALEQNFERTVSKSTADLKADLQRRNGGTQADLESLAIFHLLKNWNNNFVDENKSVIKKHIESCYQFYRGDKKIFSAKKKGSTSNSFDDIPDAVFNVKDFRTMEYLAAADDFYLGKFITDADTRRRIIAFVSEFYINQGNPLQSKELIDRFTTEFQTLVEMEEYKIRRITETTLNKARNYASVKYLDQAGVSKYEIIEIGDQKTCDWCNFMDGKTFYVSMASRLVDDTANLSASSQPNPFLTTVKIDDLKKMSVEDLAGSGYMLPSFHPHCRGRIVLAD